MHSCVVNSGLQNFVSKSLMMWCEVYFDMLNHLGENHECDRRMDRLCLICLSCAAKSKL